MSNLWHQLRVCLINEEDARAYNTCLGRLGIRAQDDNDKDLKYWWLSFWTTVGMKLPQVAVDHVEQFLATTIDQKDMNFLVILPVSISKNTTKTFCKDMYNPRSLSLGSTEF
ncbi:unnamed protein product [Rotaria sp. Silwood2]|nr:unnamed protein product [Rotaria sp. Silwood2]